MEILIKDGATYKPYDFHGKEGEFEKVVFTQYKQLFGDNTILFTKQKIKTSTNIGTIPDGFVIDFEKEKWFIIEIEISNHDVYKHIVPQLTKFKSALDHLPTRKELKKYFINEIETDPFKKALLLANGKNNTFETISEIIDENPELIIIIEQEHNELKSVFNSLPFKTVINVFKVFCREGFGLGDNIFQLDIFATGKRITKEKSFDNKPGAQEFSSARQEGEQRTNAPSPSASEWVKLIPELSDIPGLTKWAHICKHLKIDPKGASATLVLRNWVKRNKRDWEPVPNV